MEVDQMTNRPHSESEKRAKENSSAAGNHGDAHMNGISNGIDRRKEHKSERKEKERSHKSEHRDKDRNRDKEKSHKSEHKDKDKHKHSVSNSVKDKDKCAGSSSSNSKDKEKEKKSSSSSSSKDKEREHKSTSSVSAKDKEKDREKSRDHHKSSSSSKDKDKERHHSSSKDKESSRSKDKDKHRHESSSHDKDKSISKDRKHSSSKDKERHSTSHSSSDKDKSRSSDKDRHRHDKDKEKDKDRYRHDRDRDKSNKNRDDREKREIIKEEPKIKVENEIHDKMNIHNDSQMNYHHVEIKNEQYIKDEQVTQVEMEDDDDESRDGLCIKEDDDEYCPPENNSMDSTDGNDTRLSDLHNTTLKTEDDSDDSDIPLSKRTSASPHVKRKNDSSDDEDLPLSNRKRSKNEVAKKKKKRKHSDDEEDDDVTEKKPKKKKAAKPTPTSSPRKKKKEEESAEVWKWLCSRIPFITEKVANVSKRTSLKELKYEENKDIVTANKDLIKPNDFCARWEEEKKSDGTKWHFLEHKGPVFAPDYEPLPSSVKFYYNGKEMKLSEPTEEVATFYARMLTHDYTTKKVFNDNFFKDWRDVMTEHERSKIMDLSKCNFREMNTYFEQKSEERKAMSKEEKKAIKEKNEEILKEYGFCTIDGHKEKIGNFKIEPPGLFRGRGEHPKMGKLKKRVLPEDVLINCSRDSVIPKPPPGHRWKEIRHDQNVTWLASWTENVQGQVKYVMLNPSSKLKGEKDWQKYETARKLAKSVEKIRAEYREDWKSKEMRIRQRAVALYFIDKLALRAGNEKDEDQADTVGCCSLRVEHITLYEHKDGKDHVVVFDFPGKDSIRYYNEVPVEKRVFKNLQLFKENKSEGDDLFDRLNTTVLNKHLNELMEGLTAKVFRTYNASWTLQQQLDISTNMNDTVAEKILSYNRANRAVAVLCNHQRSVPKTHAKSMENLTAKIETKKTAIKETEDQVKEAKRECKHGSMRAKDIYEKTKKKLEKLKEQLTKLEVQALDREENKAIALGTSKLNYLDPRITVAWCKKYD
ncbi:hypothetical protein PV326_000758, partial [Microctonus aethiopoides]